MSIEVKGLVALARLAEADQEVQGFLEKLASQLLGRYPQYPGKVEVFCRGCESPGSVIETELDHFGLPEAKYIGQINHDPDCAGGLLAIVTGFKLPG